MDAHKMNHVLISVSPAVVRRELKVEKSGEVSAAAISGHLVITEETTSESGTALAPLMETVAARVKGTNVLKSIGKRCQLLYNIY
jgi:hypothetical protein